MFWASADNHQCRFSHHCHRQTSQHYLNIELKKKYIDFSINLLNLTKPFNSGLGKWMHNTTRNSDGVDPRIHAAGEASSSITMVVVFVGCLCWCGLTRDVTSSLYVKMVRKNLKMRLTALLCATHWLAPYHMHYPRTRDSWPSHLQSSETSF
jgi:hypothetical protein